MNIGSKTPSENAPPNLQAFSDILKWSLHNGIAKRDKGGFLTCGLCDRQGLVFWGKHMKIEHPEWIPERYK